MNALPNGWAAVFYVLALILFAADAGRVHVARVNLLALGLACAVFVLAWNALALAT